MEDEKKEEWLEDQMMQVPIEVYIKLRLELAEAEKKYSEALSRTWTAESNFEKAKEQIKELLGMKEGADAE